MSSKSNNLISQESRKDYSEESAEETKALAQGDGEFDRANDKFEKAHAEENACDTVSTEKSVARARSQSARNMAGYTTGMANNPGEEEEDENAEGNCKQPETNHVGVNHCWGKESAGRARSERAGKLAGYATGIANEVQEG